MVFGICENGEGKLVFLFLQGLEVCTGCLGYMFLESCPVKNESLFPHPLHPLLPASLAGTWPGSGRQQVVRGEGLRPLEPIHPPATFPQAAVPIACAGSVTSDAMDRLGSRCPLPGSTRPSIFICFLVSVPQYDAVKEGPHLEMTGASRGFSRAAAPVWGFSRGTTGSSGSLSCGNREVRSPWAGQGGARHCSQVRVGESGLMTG